MSLTRHRCDASGFGEGHSFLGTVTASTDGGGNASWSGTFPAVPGELQFTTTTQDSVFNTSEFSQCFAAAGALPTISISDVSQSEGNSGTTNFVFTVTISATANATVNFATANGTATAGSDYVATSGTVTFTNGGPLTQTITVQVNGDATVGPDETFFVNLSNPVGATILDAQGQGTIVNDDVAATPSITINDVSQNEGNSGTTNFVFTARSRRRRTRRSTSPPRTAPRPPAATTSQPRAPSRSPAADRSPRPSRSRSMATPPSSATRRSSST